MKACRVFFSGLYSVVCLCLISFTGLIVNRKIVAVQWMQMGVSINKHHASWLVVKKKKTPKLFWG